MSIVIQSKAPFMQRIYGCRDATSKHAFIIFHPQLFECSHTKSQNVPLKLSHLVTFATPFFPNPSIINRS